MSTLIDILMPEEQQEGTKAFIGQWLKKPGDAVKKDEPIVELSTDKVSVEIASPAEGVLAELLKNPNEKVEPGMVLGRIKPGAVTVARTAVSAAPQAAAPPPVQRATTYTSPPPAPVETQRGAYTPAVKALIKKRGITAAQLATVRGSGTNGRITREDLERAHLIAPRGLALTARTVPHTPMRQSIAAHMVQSLLHTAPHVTTVFECDCSAILAHREAHTAAFQAQGARLTLTSYFVRAAVEALAAVPEVNSQWFDDRLEIFGHCHIGVATAIEGGPGQDAGLIVPVLKHAEQLDLLGTARGLEELTSKARSGKLQKSEVQGATFSVSNHGVSGSLVATPIIIPQPQSAILGLGKLEKRVVVRTIGGHDTIQVRPLLYVTLTLDHRVLDGFKANAFLTAFVRAIESWPVEEEVL